MLQSLSAMNKIISQRMFEKIGMKKKKMIKQSYKRDGMSFDVLIYSISQKA